MRIKVRQFLTKEEFCDNPMPMRTMFGTIERESDKAYYVKLHGKLMPTTECLHCGKELKHPISLLYGLGSVCGKHFYKNPCETKEDLALYYKDMCAAMAKLTWEGWLPKSGIVEMVKEERIQLRFVHNNQQYVTTVDATDITKLEKIRKESNVLQEQTIFV